MLDDNLFKKLKFIRNDWLYENQKVCNIGFPKNREGMIKGIGDVSILESIKPTHY